MVDSSQDISLYIHIPFCKHKCPYCHFYVIGDKECFKEQLIDALEREWRQVQPKLQGKKLVSIYFGGGTPTLFGTKRIETVLSWFQKEYNYSSDIEVTIETNPEELVDFRQYKEIGINRVSLGVQSLAPDELAILDRRHKPQQSLDAIWAIKNAGIDNLTIDLMYDLPGQSMSSWQATLSAVKTLPITHLSLYNLTIEPDAAFFKREKELRSTMPDDDTSALMYKAAQDVLQESGFKQYEISAFCKDNLYSRHNVGYWTGRHFYGLGPSAFSFDGNKRFKNVANLARYWQILEQNDSPIDFEEPLDPISRKKELLALNLRLLDGFDINQYAPLEPDTTKALAYLEKVELITRNDTHIALSPKGILFYDTVASELI
ncbi:MAG: radical SAM family heme chaperone HemW [Chlamydiales bacterium]|nr:radical SAM family heme chaperone HemW [Chlamydiales bacterium]